MDEDDFSVTLEAAVFPQHGYPFLLRHRVRYELAEDGLVVRQDLINDSQIPRPWLGAHPYLRLGDVPSEDLTVRWTPRPTRWSHGRLIRAAEPVSGDFDLRGGRLVGTLDPIRPTRTWSSTAASPGTRCAHPTGGR